MNRVLDFFESVAQKSGTYPMMFLNDKEDGTMLNFNVDTTDNVRLTYQGEVKSNDIVLHFHTLNNNNPQSNQDLIAFYEADDSGMVAADAKPLQITPVNRPLAETDIRVKNVPRQQRSYAFAYVQGCDSDKLQAMPFSKCQVSSLLALPKNASGGPAYNITLNIQSTGDLVTLSYTGIPHTEPKNAAWAGIWVDQNLDLSKAPAIFYPVTDGGWTGDLQIDGLLVNTDYYLGYFLDGYSTSKAKLTMTHQAAFIRFRTEF